MASVEVLHSPALGEAIYRGLQTCGSVWVCPVCAARISEHRRRELGTAVEEWRSKGGRVVMVTYTIRHKSSDDLNTSVDQLLDARRKLRAGSPGQRLITRNGIIGSVRALEVTHGANGWHPHIHELLFVEEGCDTVQLEEMIRNRWDHVLMSKGMREVNEHGIKVQDTYEAVGDYIAKWGEEPEWTESHELAKQVVKEGREGSRAPMGLLLDYCLGDQQAGRLFQEYAHAFKGRHQLVWSDGLRDFLLPWLKDVSDEAISGDTSDYPVLLATFTLDQWRVILGNDAQGEVLQVASEGCSIKLWEYVGQLLMNRPETRRRE